MQYDESKGAESLTEQVAQIVHENLDVEHSNEKYTYTGRKTSKSKKNAIEVLSFSDVGQEGATNIGSPGKFFKTSRKGLCCQGMSTYHS